MKYHKTLMRYTSYEHKYEPELAKLAISFSQIKENNQSDYRTCDQSNI